MTTSVVTAPHASAPRTLVATRQEGAGTGDGQMDTAISAAGFLPAAARGPRHVSRRACTRLFDLGGVGLLDETLAMLADAWEYRVTISAAVLVGVGLVRDHYPRRTLPRRRLGPVLAATTPEQLTALASSPRETHPQVSLSRLVAAAIVTLVNDSPDRTWPDLAPFPLAQPSPPAHFAAPAAPASEAAIGALLAIMAGPPMAWAELALCAQIDHDPFFPGKGESAEPAKRICRACLARKPCLEEALDRDEKHGVWGGLSRQQRVAEASRRRSGPAGRDHRRR